MSNTESFESIIDSLLEGMLCSIQADNLWGKYSLVKGRIERLKAAHDREIRDTAQQQYHRGFHAGQHSMDAEHRAIAMRLRGLRFDGGSHENLRRIAYAIYPCATGWTCESADGLRDKLIDLMGGVSDENVHVGGLRCDDGCMGDVSNGGGTGRTHGSPSNRDRNHMAVRKGVDTMIGDSDDTCDSQCRGACADCDGGDSGEHEEVEHGGAAHDSGADSRGGDGGGDIHMDGLVAYDVLGNERHKAVCALRRWKPEKAINNDHCGEIQIRILYQLLDLGGAMMMDGADAAKKVRDRLVHLLGGDQPSGIDVLRAMDDGHSRTCPKSDEEMSESAPSVSITDELRECVDTAAKSYDNTPWYDMDKGEEADHTTCHITEGELMRIADRIDEWFDRICQQHEDVLQETIAEMVKEYEHDRLPDQLRIEKLVEQRDAARSGQDVAEYHTLCDELRDQRDGLMRKWLREHAECDELRKKLERARGGIDILQFERGELQEKMDEYDSTHVELPRDANGEVFHIGCTVRMVGRHPEVLLTVHSMTLRDDGEWLLFAWDDKGEYSCNLSTLEFEVYEKPQDTAESIARDLSIGSIMEAEAIRRIEALNG